MHVQPVSPEANTYTEFEQFDSAARLWVLPLNSELTPEQEATLALQLAQFIRGWKSHGSPVRGTFAVTNQRFVLIAASEQSGVSGCSIDGLMREVSTAARVAGVELADLASIFYRAKNQVMQASRGEFAEIVKGGVVGAETVVFDCTVGTMQSYRDGRFELPMKDSWHARAF